jgi:hypothetical protein
MSENHDAPQHDAKNCRLCAMHRHPAARQNAQALREHLAANPLPGQRATQR